MDNKKKIEDINKEKELSVTLSEIEKQLKKHNSATRRFLLGIIGGLGTFIGATIVAGLGFVILSETVDTVEDVPVLNKIIDSLEIKAVLENNGNQPD